MSGRLGLSMYSQVFPQVECQLGGERILLPHQTHPEISSVRYYWPTDRDFLTLVCREHGHMSVYSKTDVRLEPLPPSAHNLRTNFWKVEFRCDWQNCGCLVLAH